MANYDEPQTFILSSEEQIFLRLYRCMNTDEQEDTLVRVFKTLGARCSFDPYYTRRKPEDFAAELNDDDLNDRLMAAWPGAWPSPQIVDLDFVGDPGAWLYNELDENVLTELFGVPCQHEIRAEQLADSYLRKIREEGYPLPSDFDDDPVYSGWTDEDELGVRAEFRAFLAQWRESVIATLERQKIHG